ncbi:hypothetical protein GCM10009557_28260 [Virgisporangium ochraceum]|uniref:Uncharacterized protein n=1 Tax=Virgisporangium ochraceum TaxID=65505 RepID=A0A8J4EEE8_9ACTN|nr:hypothetical protein [Virgisporangium ochraceum]GIJ71548.1 hypothetical protein Voc01_064650 [Virgisporangium ochraceum]
MLEFQTARTTPHPEIDLLTRIRLLELQVAAVADAERVADLLDEAKVPRL